MEECICHHGWRGARTEPPQNNFTTVKMAREAAFVSRSASITTPGRCSTEITPRPTVDEIAKELGGAQDVLGLLEGNGIDGGFAFAVDDAGAVDGKSKVDQ